MKDKVNNEQLILISKKLTLKMMLGIFCTLILFHMAIITFTIPYTLIWGGKLKNDSEMYVFEAMAISINIFLIIMLLLKGNYVNHKISDKILNGILWIFVVVFGLNTIGNLIAETMFEKLIFTPLSFISALLIRRIPKK